MTLGGTATDLAHELVQLLLVENAFAFALKLVSRGLREGRLVHDTSADAAAGTVGGTTRAANPADAGRWSGHLGGLVREDLRNGEFGLQILRWLLRL